MSIAASERGRTAVLAATAAAIVAAVVSTAGLFTTLDRAFLDLQTRWLQHEVASDVVIVEIDARTLKELGQWPLPRSLHAELIEKLARAGGERIFLDIDFSTASAESEDARLAAALASLRAPAVLPAFWQPYSTGTTALILSKPLPHFAAHARLGLVDLVPGADGLVREVADPTTLPAGVAPVWAMLTADSAVTSSALTLDYRIAPSSFERRSYVDILRSPKVPRLNGKTIFVGATAVELGDIVAVPVHRALPGVVVQAIAYESARAGSLMTASSVGVLVALVPWIGLCAWMLVRGRWRQSPLLAAALSGFALAGASVLYAVYSIEVPASPFVCAALTVWIASLLRTLGFEAWRSWWAMRRARDQDQLLRRVIDHSSDAVLTLDSSTVVRTANPAAHAMFGAAENALIGTHLDSFAPQLSAILKAPHDVVSTLSRALTRADGSRVAVEVSKAELRWEQDVITTLTLRDVTLQHNREAELRHLAMHDALTGLPNRAFLAERIDTAFRDRGGQGSIALLMLDLDGFKEVNDTLGHSMGDALMRELGVRLAQLADVERHVARVGGDEFAVLCNVADSSEVAELAQQLVLLVEDPIVIKGIPVSLGTSIGVALSPEHAADGESLLKHADVALYLAKRKKTGIEFYDPSTDTNSPRRLEMLTLLRAAVSRNELMLHYQPKVALASGDVTEVEALCRWDSPVLGPVAPSEFIGLAEASDIIRSLTEWTIHQALVDCREWHDQGVNLQVAVNLSARHMQDAHLPRWLESVFRTTGTRPQWLELEITESAIMMDPERAARILHALRELGVLISIDDFGTGYSSLAYLRTLAVDRLKIDRSFIAGIDQGEREQIIVESTIKLAHGLGLSAVAEGIETQSQYSILRSLGCDIGQGYLIAKPMPKRLLIDWHQKRTASWPVPNKTSTIQRPIHLRDTG
jgi:diguanylate cyclase (GGDEF)-like protein/PAS domain S-box-containing protein